MNKFYFIVPTVLIAAFVFIYLGHSKEMHEKMEKARIQAEAKIKEESKKKAEGELKASEDAKKRQEERDRQEREKEEEKRRKQAEADQKVADETNKALSDADRLSKEIAKIEADLTSLHAVHEKSTKAAFDAAKNVELMRINRRTAELQVQRMTEIP